MFIVALLLKVLEVFSQHDSIAILHIWSLEHFILKQIKENLQKYLFQQTNLFTTSTIFGGMDKQSAV